MTSDSRKGASTIMDEVNQARQRNTAQMGKRILALEKLVHICAEMATIDWEESLRSITKGLLELTEGQRAILLLSNDGVEVKPHYAVNCQGEILEEQVKLSSSLVERAMKTGQVLIVDNVPRSAFRNCLSMNRLRLNAILVVPLMTQKQILGALYVDTDNIHHSFDNWDLTIFKAFGTQAAISLANADAFLKSQRATLFVTQDNTDAHRFDLIVYQSEGMHKVRQQIERVMNTDSPVLIQGESGTGKELVAQAIHNLGNRRVQPFLDINCGSVPKDLLESEFFGHRRGAFSGAASDKRGLVEAANTGTLFLDELGDASPSFQGMLLRFLETKQFRRVGETQNRQVDVRIVAATHRDLIGTNSDTHFREDLYYRLSVFLIRVPSLRERPEDIPVLMRHFVNLFNGELKKCIRSIDPETLAWAEAQKWPGNIRQLKNWVYRGMLYCESDVFSLDLLPKEFQIQHGSKTQDGPLKAEAKDVEPKVQAGLKTLEAFERDYLKYVLEYVGGNKAQAAKVLGLPRSTFRARLRKLGIYIQNDE